MKKHLFILLYLAALPIFGQEQVIDIQLNAPSSVVAGSDFEVSVAFNKGDLKDYSRFSQDLPSGFTASNIESPNADFTFSDQRIRIIWLKLPADNIINVRYSIHVHERLSGTLKLSGTFAYVNNGERAYLDLPETATVEIMPNPDIDPSMVVDIADFSSISTSVNVVEPSEISDNEEFAQVVRQTPVLGPNGSVYVSLLVKKPLGTTYLKLEETIPGGYSFESIDASWAVVSQASSMARFVWMKLPEANTFTVKYRLIPILEKDQQEINIEGNLTFTEKGETKVAPVREEEVNIEAMNDQQQLEYLSTGKVPAGLPEVSRETVIADVGQSIQEPVQSKPAERKDIPESGHYRKSSGSSIIDIFPLQIEQGVYYRVQVAAVRKPYFPRVYFADYDLLRDVKLEDIDKWRKYTVGSVLSYEEALKLRDTIRKETPQSDAFIVAYKDGRRVPPSSVK